MREEIELLERKGIQIVLQAICWSVLFVMSVYYYKERVCFGDASSIIVDLIHKKQMVFVHHRYSMLLTYFLPLVFIKMGLGLKSILIAFSFNQFISTMIISIITIKVTKSIKTGWLFLFAQVFWVQESFFYYVVEPITFLIPISYFLIANHFLEKNEKRGFIISGIIILPFVFISSPNITLLFLLLSSLLFILYYKNHAKEIAAIMFLCLIGYLLVKWALPFNGYEQMKFEILKENLKNYQHLNDAAMHYFAKMHYFNELIYWISGVFVIGSLMYQKRWIFLSGALLIIISAHYITCIYLYQWDTNTYMEMYYQMVGVCVCVFIYTTLNLYYNSSFNTIFFFVVIIFSFERIHDCAKIFVARINHFERIFEIMEENKINKAFIHNSDPGAKFIIIGWATAFESVLLSSLDGNTKTIFMGEALPEGVSKDAFVSSIGIFDPQENILNKTYFNLKKEDYTLLELTK